MTTAALQERRKASGEIGVFPSEWDVHPLRSLCQKTSTVDPSKTPDRVFEYVDVSAVSNELWNITSSTRVTGSAAPSRARKRVKSDDVIFATVRPTLKRVAIIPDYLDEQIVSTAFCVLRADPVRANPYFIYYSLLTDEFIDRMGKLQQGASYPAVNDSDVFEQNITVPPLSEQRSVAAVLSKIQAAVAAQDKIVSGLKELKAATMAKLFREGLHGEKRKQTEIGEMPESWEFRTIASLGEIVTGTTPPTKNPEHYRGPYPFIAPGDIGDYRIVRRAQKTLSDSGVKVSRPLPPRSVLIVCIGSTIGKVGMTHAKINCTNQQINAIVCDGDVFPEFVHYLMVWNSERIKNISTPSPVPILTKGAFEKAVVALPRDKSIQQQIANILCSIDDRMELAKRRRESINFLFSSMLHLLMTGRVRVTDIDGTAVAD